jgi:hypothetical protein
MAKATFNMKKTFLNRRMELTFRKKLVKCCIWSTTLFGAEIGTLREVDWKYTESLETLCWRSMEKII